MKENTQHKNTITTTKRTILNSEQNVRPVYG
jgi:hypothetical protein